MSADARTAIKIALLSTSTTQLLTGPIRSEMRKWGWEARIWEAGFNQYRQEIANANSLLYEQKPDLVILNLEAEDLFADCLREPFSYNREARRERAHAAAAETERWASVIQERLPRTLIVVNTVFLPPIHTLTGLEFHSSWGMADFPAQYNLELVRIASGRANLLFHDVASIAMQVGYRQWFDPRLWYLARTRLSSNGAKEFARSLAALFRGWKGQTRKCIVLDLDNTLWGGIVGEDGVSGIAIGEEGIGLAYAEFQGELANLERKGILLAICSKNNEADAMEVLRQHPFMRLREKHFAAMRINWEDKATNLGALAQMLNLGLDSMVFIDDNPVERELIRAALPEVMVPDWPSDPSDYKAALLDMAAQHFPRVSLTIEDTSRTAMYHSESQRQELSAASTNLEDYFRSLQMRVEIGLANDANIPRIAQLTQKTNQFNLTTVRYTESEIRELASSPEALVFWLRLYDRFADNGIVGVLILKEMDPTNWIIDTFLLSCRVLGRAVESAFLAHVCQTLIERGAKSVLGQYRPTIKNSLVANLYQEFGFVPVEGPSEVILFKLFLTRNLIAKPDWIEMETPREMLNA